MIVVKVEVWPGGDPAKACEIAEMKIWNEEKGQLSERGECFYGYVARGIGYEISGSRIVHNRQQDRVWKLIQRVVESMGGPLSKVRGL